MDSLKLEIKQLLIEAFDLEHLTPADIDDDAPLFDTNGVGLDSIDALEIGIVLRKHFQLTVTADDTRMRDHFRCVNSLAALIASQQKAATTVAQTASKGE
ncbi:phosphopantetheine-binding protein [Burkholderia pyrrocinia]|uniref:phosphopantetheine-binding protein n=1 Tax=Burkholderia pyrrocinia TaxID=60550 RepID=UPI00158D3D28|nr:phosphopantetheine-binding protein [Burkholderia pyrrocinia]